MPSPVLIAASFVVLQAVTTAVVVGFTPPHSILRPAALPLVVFWCYAQQGWVDIIQHPVLRGFIGSAPIYLTILYICHALIDKWTFEAGGPNSTTGGLHIAAIDNVPTAAENQETLTSTSKILSRFRFGLWVSTQSRFPQSPWAVKNIPPFSRHDEGHTPTRAIFLLGHITKIAQLILVLHIASMFANPGANPLIYALDKVPLFSRIHDIEPAEIITRTSGVLAYWIGQYTIISLAYSAFAFVGVVLGLTQPGDWPPVFGYIGDSYSLRQFWGCFYHQLVRRGCSSPSYLITYSYLGLGRGSLVGRYVFLFLVFAISGIFHAFSDTVTQRIPWEESGAMTFFCLQAVGIMIEDAVQALDRQWKPLLLQAHGKKAWGLVNTWMGYLWVVLWLVWSSPVWIYPHMRRDKGDPIIDFSGLKW